MNEKEIAEIRRCFRPEKSNITHIRGCYVNEKKEMVSEFNQSLTMMPQEEAEKMLAILKRTLSGALGKNLLDITFTTQQVVDSPEHKLLMALRDSSLQDEDAIHEFFNRVMESFLFDSDYLILLALDKYDVPYRAKDGLPTEDAASEVYTYFLCSICPVKMTKPALSYDVPQNAFHNCRADWIVAPPEAGFLFPAFDNRTANIYNALYYTHSTAENHQELIDAVFHLETPPMPAEAQKEAFQTLLADTLAEECSYEMVQAVHDQICEMIEEHKASKEEEPLVLSKNAVKTVLESCGVADTHMEAFEEKYSDSFGEQTELSPINLVDIKQFRLRTPDVTIHVNPDRRDLVETRVIDGVKYILIRADEGVEVNGVAIRIDT